MSRRELILGAHREAIVAAARANKATGIALIGSVARGDDGPGSDVDFLARFAPGATLFDQSRLLGALRELLGVEVDVLSVGGLKPESLPRHREILAEAIRL